jgi:hypothetical protein
MYSSVPRDPGCRRLPCAEGDVIDFYQVLGVDRDASAEEVRRAYRRLAREHHPDVNPDPDAARRFRRITEAYQALSEDQARASQPPPDPGDAADGLQRERQPEPTAAAHPPAPDVNPLARMSVLVSVAAVCLPGPLLCWGYLGVVGALLGHTARWRIRRSGEAGAGLALAGVLVGWAATVVTVAATVAGVWISRNG